MRGNKVADLSPIDVPITLAWSEFDQVVRNRPLKEGILPERVRQVALPGCGHVPTWDDPELVAQLILEGEGPWRSRPRLTSPRQSPLAHRL
jgi:pimeloyl-ACP methyl ester carboxylesterase